MVINERVYTLSFFNIFKIMIKNIIYNSVIFFIVLILVSLPLIKIPISTSARGIVRSSQENIPISIMVSGRVIKNYLEKNNQNIF